VRRIRAEQKFADLAALQAQIAKDSELARQTLGLLG
jgi:FAD synthase